MRMPDNKGLVLVFLLVPGLLMTGTGQLGGLTER